MIHGTSEWFIIKQGHLPVFQLTLTKTLLLAITINACTSLVYASSTVSASTPALSPHTSVTDAENPPNLEYPPPGQPTPIIRLYKGEQNTGAPLTAEHARQRVTKYEDRHYLIDRYFRLVYPGDDTSLLNKKNSRSLKKSSTALHSSKTLETPVVKRNEAHNQDPYALGLLWRVTSKDEASSHIFGTMHVDDPRVTQLPYEVQRAFDESATLTIEALLDAPELLSAGSKLLLTGGDTLDGLIGKELYSDLLPHLQNRRIPSEFAKRLKPWAVAVLLGQNRSLDGIFLDQQLSLSAKQNDKPVFGLETLNEQLQIFDDMPTGDQRILLRETLRNMEKYPSLLETVTQAYLARDLKKLISLSHQTSNTMVEQKLMRRLVSVRNKKMVERMKSRLVEGDAFIALGALHLPGKDGVLRLLDKEGYEITRVY